MATLSLISFCLVLLLGSPDGGQAATAYRLAQQERLEIRASGWHALLGNIVDTARLNNIIMIGTMGTLDLPRIGRLLGAAQAELEAMNAQIEQRADAVAPGREAAEASINAARELAARERAKSDALEEKLLDMSKDVDATKNGAQLGGGKLEEILRRALAAARRDLDAMRRLAEKQRQRAEALERDLRVVLRVVEDLEAKAAGAMRSKAAALRARDAAEAALADKRRAVDEVRQKLGAYERDLAVARQSAATPEPDANLAAAEKAAALLSRQIAEAAARRAGEELALEREKARSLARDLDTARQERDAAKKQLTRILAAQRRASEDARDRAGGRDLAAARREIDVRKARTERRVADIENAPKASAGYRASARVKSVVPTVPPVTILLPDALLPKRSRMQGLW